MPIRHFFLPKKKGESNDSPGHKEQFLFLLLPASSYKTKVFFDDDNDRPELQGGVDEKQDEFQDNYGLVDMAARFDSSTGKFAVELFAKNVLDKDYLLDAGNTGDGFGLPTFIPGPDRLIGLTLTGRF